MLPHEAKPVLSIPLSHCRPADSLFWQRTKTGVYSTKSANQMLDEAKSLSEPGQSTPIAHNGFWKKIWGINVPNKIKHFLQRACCEALPTKKNLHQRKVIRNSVCEFYAEEVEDTIHVLWECQVIREIWWEVEQCRNNLSTRFTCFSDLLTGIFQYHEPNLAELFAFITWLWTKMNASQLRNCSISYLGIFADAKDRLQEYQVAQTAKLTYHCSVLPVGRYLQILSSKRISIELCSTTCLALALEWSLGTPQEK